MKRGRLHDLEPMVRFELCYCKTCGAAEGELLAWCPGFKLSPEALNACYDGNVIDIRFWKLNPRNRERYQRYLRRLKRRR